MSKVVSNTSPIQYLHQLGLLHLLQGLFRELIVPQGVIQELERGRLLGVNLPDVSTITWMNQQRAARPLPPDSYLIIDDTQGRTRAAQLGLALTGTAGVLIQAKRAHLLHAVAPYVGRLVQLVCYLTPTLRAHILKLAGE